MSLRKSLATLLSGAMLFSMVTIPAAAEETGDTLPSEPASVSYDDVKDHWAEGAIDRWSSYGVVKGDNGDFRPDANMSVAELATVLDNLMGYTEKAPNTFADLNGDEWYADAVLKCAAAGVIKGDGKNVDATAPIDRERATVIMARALNIQPEADPDLGGFNDGAAAADWSAGYIKAMADAGIVQGVGNGTLDLASSINRASIMTIMDKSISDYITEGGTYEAKDTGITIVKAGAAVTLTGTAQDIIVAPAAVKGSVTLDKATVTGAITLNADNAQLVAKDAKLAAVTVNAAGAALDLQGKSSTQSVLVAETANGAVLNVAKDAKVENATVAATGTTTEISGTVNTIGVAATAADTQIKVEKGATVSKVDTAGDDTTVTGAGNVKTVNVAEGKAAEVKTPNTVTTQTETTVDKNGNTVTVKTETTNNSKGEAGTIKTETTTTKPDGSTSTENKTETPNKPSGGGSSGPSYITVATEADLKTQMAAGGHIRLGSDIAISDTLTVPAGKTVTMDLNGKKITTTQTQATGKADPDVYMIVNKGTLTIDGSTAGSEIKAEFNTENANTRQVRAMLNAEGTLTLNSGTYSGYYVITNNTSNAASAVGTVNINTATLNGCFAAVANFQNATTNITNSTLTAYYYALANNGTYGKTVFNVTGSTMSSTADTAIYFPAGDELTLANCTVNAPQSSAIEAFAGKVSLKGNTTINAGGNYVETVSASGEGSRMDGSAVLLGYRAGYKTTGKVELNVDESVQLNSTNGHCIRIVLLGAFNTENGIREIDLSYYSANLNTHGQAGIANNITTIPDGLKVSTTVFDEAALSAAATAGGTVVLGCNITAESDVSITKEVSLDLNGETLTLNGTKEDRATITVDGSTAHLTIDDSKGGGVIACTESRKGTDNLALINAYRGADITMEGGKINADFGSGNMETAQNDGTSAFAVFSDSTFTMNGGEIIAGWYAVSANGTTDSSKPTYGNNAKIVINDGMLISTGDYAIYAPADGGETEIHGGTIKGAWGAVQINRGTLTMTGGDLYNTSGVIGTKPENQTDGSTPDVATAISAKAAYGAVTVTISGGRLYAGENVAAITKGANATIAITAGTFTSDVSAYCDERYECTGSGTDWTVGPKASADTEALQTVEEDAAVEPEDTVTEGVTEASPVPEV